MLDPERKRALVTAAEQGMGRATAGLFAVCGCEVIASGISEAALAEPAEISGITAPKLEVRGGPGVEEAIAEIGPPDVLFNCAGYMANGMILDRGEQEGDLGFDLNAKAMYRPMRLAPSLMLERGGGSIIDMSSLPARACPTVSSFALPGSW